MYRNKYRLIIPFLFPALALYLTFVVYPYARSMIIAFTSWRGVSANIQFNGLANFERMINDENFWNALGNNLFYLIMLPVATIAMSLFLAFMLSQRVRFSNFYRIVFFFPQVMSVIAIGVLWSYVYHPTIGILTPILEFLRLESFFQLISFDGIPVWMGDPKTAKLAVGGVVIWQAAGFFMVLFMAAMQDIPEDFYEAAAIDGATRWQMFWKITLPLLWDTLRAAAVFSMLGAFNMFPLTMVMTNGQRGPNRATDVLATYLYEQAFEASRFGYATAMAVALFLIVLTISVGIMQATQRKLVQY